MGEQFAAGDERAEFEPATIASKEAFRSSVSLLTVGGKESSQQSGYRRRAFVLGPKSDLELSYVVGTDASDDREAGSRPQTIAEATFVKRLGTREDRRESYHLRENGTIEVFVDVVDPIEFLQQQTLLKKATRSKDRKTAKALLESIERGVAHIERGHENARRRGETKVSETKLKEINEIFDAIIRRHIFGKGE